MADEREVQIVLRARDEASKTINGVADSSDGLIQAFKRNDKQAGLTAGAVVRALALAESHRLFDRPTFGATTSWPVRDWRSS